MPSSATSIEAYLAALPDDRRDVMTRLREVIDAALPPGFEPRIQYGMPSWVVPLSRYPKGYHCNPTDPLPFLSIASQKNFVALYHMGMYADAELLAWFQAEYPKHARTKLDMGKSCVRFKKVADIPYALISELCGRVTPDAWVSRYEANLAR
ncbi:MAG: DUF1801 domain-containing protein [Myxococcales bacterium]|nr:DUF1801 domain-containing protein [Myxococcales bacterium]MCB9531173.1 DUF1801 domain-containing protein [Myxococcales bacterium]